MELWFLIFLMGTIMSMIPWAFFGPIGLAVQVAGLVVQLVSAYFMIKNRNRY